MKVLGLDTSNKFLTITLMDDDKVIFHIKLDVYRNASEITNYQIDAAFKEAGWKPSDLDAVVTTRGPGSFTGIRIGMSIAKVICTTLNIPLYSLSSLNYLAGIKDVSVVIDARSSKVYYGEYKNGKTLKEGMYNIEALELVKNQEIIGEASILGLEDKFYDLKDNFILLRQYWQKESALDAKPEYYKSNLW